MLLSIAGLAMFIVHIKCLPSEGQEIVLYELDLKGCSLVQHPWLKISPLVFVYAACLVLPRIEHAVQGGGSCAEHSISGRAKVNTLLFCCCGLAV